MPTRAVNGAWVREKKRPAKKVDPTVSLFPALRYFGCRPNMPDPHQKKLSQQQQDFDDIEIVEPATHQRPSSRHEPLSQQRVSPQSKMAEHEMRRPGSSSNRHSKRPMGRPGVGIERQLRSSGALRQSRTTDARQYAGTHNQLRTSPYVSRAMAVNMNAMTPLAM